MHVKIINFIIFGTFIITYLRKTRLILSLTIYRDELGNCGPNYAGVFNEPGHV